MVTLDGSSSNWTNSGDLALGVMGTGGVTQTGGTNSVAGTLLLGYDTTGTGTYNLNGGTLILHSLAKNAGMATFNFGGGTLQASNDFTCSLPMNLTGTGGDANVDTAGYAVTLSGNLSGSGGLSKLGAGTLTLTGPNAYGWTRVNAGTLNITGGGSVSNAGGYIGNIFRLDGHSDGGRTGSTWTNSSDLYVGYYGNGTLNITRGGSVSSTDGIHRLLFRLDGHGDGGRLRLELDQQRRTRRWLHGHGQRHPNRRNYLRRQYLLSRLRYYRHRHL